MFRDYFSGQQVRLPPRGEGAWAGDCRAERRYENAITEDFHAWSGQSSLDRIAKHRQQAWFLHRALQRGGGILLQAPGFIWWR